MDVSAPQGKPKCANRRTVAPWYNEDVKSKKTVLNRAKKLFRNNETPGNFQQLKDSEEEFELVYETKQKQTW